MAAEENQFISKINPGFPEYLDWEKLRASGLDYLGKLSGKIWTDHNVHDPGITILEILCYAIMDLGYRTNLPVEDILARNPDDKSKDNNFFTAADILACNPLTITDIRKMLVDIPGVKNAWVEDNYYECVKDDVQQLCNLDYCFNGLYRVYIEADKIYDKNNPLDIREENQLIEQIRKALMYHRNLCEDFIDIYLLCKKKIGLCADIELEVGANAESVYTTIVENLREFFSPSPKFYTLQQLLDKDRTIEDVFAGRPYNVKESHGFVDTEEFEAIKLKKEVHLSDVYHVIFDVKGIRSVKNLGWRNDCNNPSAVVDPGWIWQIPLNHIPDFDPGCSVIKFSRRGIPVAIDTEKFNSLFKIDFRHNGKVLYDTLFPYLDTEIPKGAYRSDLGDYKSIQNEFPRVYGIADGGLPPDASNERRAKAYQLKSWLLFFDQLLANYVSQLKNIRSLFALPGSENKKDRHTYFLSPLTDVPDLKKLVRFKVDGETEGFLGNDGAVLAVPVRKKWLNELVVNEEMKKVCADIDIIPFEFCDKSECDTAINNTREDLFNANSATGVITTQNNCWYFYFFTSSEQFAFISHKNYPDKISAERASQLVKYSGSFKDNFRSFGNQDHKVSFQLELRMSGYSDYLQVLVEDNNAYQQRREEFLDHLLSRFTERFTDFALLSFGSVNEKDIMQAEIKSKEYFLTHYDDLSSNRGKAYDYLYNNRNNNISGFERRAGALMGIESDARKTLCNFIVERYEEHYIIQVKFSDKQVLFTSAEKFYSLEAAENSVKELLKALQDENNYEDIQDKNLLAYRLKIHYGDNYIFCANSYTDAEDLNKLHHGIYKLFSFIPDKKKDINVSKEVLRLILRDDKGDEVASSIAFFNIGEEELATEYAARSAAILVDAAQWIFKEGMEPFTETVFDDTNPQSLKFINKKAFKKDINDTIVGRPGKFEYELLDRPNNFKFCSIDEYDSNEEALENCWKLLVPLADEKNYKPYKDEQSPKFSIEINKNGLPVARTEPLYKSSAEAQNVSAEIYQLILPHIYFIKVEVRPYRWNFSYLIGYKPQEQFLFNSVNDFENPDVAYESAKTFYDSINEIILNDIGNDTVLTIHNNNSACTFEKPDGTQPDEDLKNKADKLLDLKKEINAVVNSGEQQDYSRYITNDIDNPDLKYVYRLVDKDNPYACYLGSAASEVYEDVEALRKRLFQTPHDPVYTAIDLGGSITNMRKDEKTNVKWYHYLIRCRNQCHGNIQGMVLFESVKGYTSKETAQKAFDENYLLILKYARDKSNYGKDLFISLEPKLDHNTDDCMKNPSVVFVPDATKEIFNWYTDIIINELTQICSLYPIRYVTKADDEFYRLFPCEEDVRDLSKAATCLINDDPIKYYYYQLYGEDLFPTWRSVKYYKAPNVALHDFYFFLNLLSYPGNYFIKKDECDCVTKNVAEQAGCNSKWKIYIYEVLVESKKRFATPDKAWGEEGIEKFICVSQSANSFHTYFDTENCRYTFDVYCDHSGLIHPCNYDTPEKRDKVMEQLFKAYPRYVKPSFPSVALSNGQYHLLNSNNEPLAYITNLKKDYISNPAQICVAEIFYDVLNNPVFERDNLFTIEVYEKDPSGSNQIVRCIQPFNSALSIAEWKNQICIAACNYPVIKRPNGKYDVIIRLPGFGNCKEWISESVPCEPLDAEDDCPDCAIAWQSECCFDTCEKALDYFEKVGVCLKEHANYRPVFDCECGAYGIKLNCCIDYEVDAISPSSAVISSDQNYGNTQTFMAGYCCNEVVAFNPQNYKNPEIDCDAVQRGRKLINSEGLLLVEHILLRPRCVEDCTCLIKQCEPDPIRCNDWTWKETGEYDPCDNKKTDINFYPAKDPYSFIATVALPAWPERFRKPENRQLVENILYLETPAHILLRILWLAPAEFCRFETQYREWNYWLSHTHACSKDFSLCDFTTFLFKTDFECLPDCNECDPCNDKDPDPQGCWETEHTDADKIKNKYLNQLNKVFCWEEITCGIRNTPDTVKEDSGTTAGNVKYIEDAIVPSVSDRRDIPLVKKAVNIKDLERAKVKFFNARKTKYEETVSKINKASKRNPIAVKAQTVLQHPDPSINELSALLTEIVNNKAPDLRGARPLTEKQAHGLIQSCLCYYLDKQSFNSNLKNMKELKTISEKLRKSKVAMNTIFNHWDSFEVKKYVKKLNINETRDLIAGTPKKTAKKK
ncbi:MAG: hypothetical protein ABI691_06075 [Ginsengibacter sp.]